MDTFGSLLSVGHNWSRFNSGCGERLGRELRVTAIHDPPYFVISPQSDGSFRHDGYLFQLWKIIASMLCLRYRMVPLLAGGYGSLASNGTWTGMVGELAYGRADVALTWVLFREDRATVVDYLDDVPVDQNQYTFYLQQASGEDRLIASHTYHALWKPLHFHVWWLLVVFLFLTSVVLRLSFHFNLGVNESNQVVKEMNWSSCVLFSFMTLVSQGSTVSPDSLAARVATISSWILGMLIYHSYAANLISHLTTATSMKSPIASLEEFYTQPGWTFATEPGLGVFNDWKVSSNVYERELFGRAVSGDGYIALDVSDDSINRTLQPKVLTYIDIAKLFYGLGAKACSFVPLLENLPSKSRNFMLMAKGLESERKSITRAMLRIKETGIMARLKSHWITSGGTCTSSAETQPLTVEDVLAVLTIVPVAAAFSVAVFVSERLFSRLYHVTQ